MKRNKSHHHLEVSGEMGMRRPVSLLTQQGGTSQLPSGLQGQGLSQENIHIQAHQRTGGARKAGA